MQTIIYLGNRDAVEVTRDEGDTEVRTPVSGKRYTAVVPPAGTPLAEVFRSITDPKGVWAYHSNADNPAWVAVASEDPKFGAGLASLLSAHYGGCEIRDPDPDPAAPQLVASEPKEVSP